MKPKPPKGQPEQSPADPDLLREYDFRDAVRGRYTAQFSEGNNLVVLAPDVAAVFPDSQSVNEALRTLVRLTRQPSRT